MPRDYYADLEIHRDASETDIPRAYRKLSLRWHPKLSQEDKSTSYHNFCIVSEAFEVLHDPVKRAFYDKYGEEKLKEGFFSQGNLKGGYRFGGNPEEIFEKFFGTSNPFAQIYDSEGKEAIGSLFGYAFGAQNYPGIEGPQELTVTVDCTLNELYNGCSKTVDYKRIELNKDGRTTRQISEKKTIEIKPGFNNTTTICFTEQGNQAPGMKSSDLIFKIREKPHAQFKRKGNDLVYVAKYNLIEALCGQPVTVVTLDGRKLYIPIDEIISPKTVKQVQGEGLPIHNPDEFKVENYGKPLDKGDLFIKFDIKFPTSIPEENKDRLKILLQEEEL